MIAAQKSATRTHAASRSAAFGRVPLGLSIGGRTGRVPCVQRCSSRQVVRPVAYKAQEPEVPPAATDKKSIKVPTPKLDVDIKQLITWNFLVQLGLTAVSWATVFFTSHAGMAAGKGMHATTGILMVGVALAGYSAYLSYGYVLKVKKDGLDILQGWEQLKKFGEHQTINFVGAITTLMALQAEVGSMMMTSMTSKAASALKAAASGSNDTMAVEALAQAATNTIFAHVVSLVMLTIMSRKIMDAYKSIVDWSEQLRKSIPGFK